MTFDSNQATADPSTYQAYLIRLWRDRGQPSWRASAQSVKDGGIVRFASLDALFAFLTAKTASDKGEDVPPWRPTTDS